MNGLRLTPCGYKAFRDLHGRLLKSVERLVEERAEFLYSRFYLALHVDSIFDPTSVS
jgi:hypothetical protein